MAGSTVVCVCDFETWVSQHLPKNIKDYYESGADEEFTLKENIKAFRR